MVLPPIVLPPKVFTPSKVDAPAPNPIFVHNNDPPPMLEIPPPPMHEHAFSGMLRDQLANLIARVVLTLTDDVLGGARMDLWSAQANGPRLVAGLEHRTTATNNQ